MLSNYVKREACAKRNFPYRPDADFGVGRMASRQSKQLKKERPSQQANKYIDEENSQNNLREGITKFQSSNI